VDTFIGAIPLIVVWAMIGRWIPALSLALNLGILGWVARDALASHPGGDLFMSHATEALLRELVIGIPAGIAVIVAIVRIVEARGDRYVLPAARLIDRAGRRQR